MTRSNGIFHLGGEGRKEGKWATKILIDGVRRKGNSAQGVEIETDTRKNLITF